jgi:hypothetical protein
MGKIYLHDVKRTNVTYQYADEDIALTHVDKGQCRPQCGIKDEDTFSKVFAQLHKCQLQQRCGDECIDAHSIDSLPF